MLFRSVINTLPGLIVADSTLAVPFGVLIFTAFMSGIPEELLQAARIDGAGHLRSFWSVVLPVSRNSIVTVSLFAFLWAWSDFIFANSPSEGAKAFKAEYLAKYGDKAPQLATIGADCYSALNLAKALFDKAGANDMKKLMAASEGLSFDSASGRATMHGRQVDKDMYLAVCKGTEFEVLKTIKAVKSGTACRV